MTQYTIRVLLDEGKSVYRYYKVRCHSADDAIQLAFAIDGGWGHMDETVHDATGILELAKMYCDVTETHP